MSTSLMGQWVGNAAGKVVWAERLWDSFQSLILLSREEMSRRKRGND